MSTDIVSLGLTREAWGPRFWKILHLLAEQCGRFTDPVIHADEGDAWVILLKAQAYVMPCARCKQHYLEWCHDHRVEGLKGMAGPERRDFVRQWLWGCHNRVNELNGKSVLPLEALEVMYPKEKIEKEWRELLTMFCLALNRQKLSPVDVQRWRSVIQRFRTMYGV